MGEVDEFYDLVFMFFFSCFIDCFINIDFYEMGILRNDDLVFWAIE